MMVGFCYLGPKCLKIALKLILMDDKSRKQNYLCTILLKCMATYPFCFCLSR